MTNPRRGDRGVLVAGNAARRAERLRRLTALQRDFAALPIDDAVAAGYGQRAAAVVEIGRRPPARTTDPLLAATAHAQDARPYTRNAGDLVVSTN